MSILKEKLRGQLDVPRRARGRLGGDGWLFSRRNLRMDISPVHACVVALLQAERMPSSLSDVTIH